MFSTESDEEAYKRIWHRDGVIEGRRQMAEEASVNLLIMELGTPEQIAKAEGLPLEDVLKIEKNIQQGMHKKAVEISTKMLQRGYQIEEISGITNLTSDEVVKLKKSLKAKD